MENNRGNKKSFTLIELLVVAGIILLLTALILPQYRTGQRRLILQQAIHKLAQNLRRAEEMAMAARKVGPQGVPKIVPKGGYGIYLNETQQEIILFADCDGDRQYTISPENVCGEAPNKFPEKIEEIYLEEEEKEVKIVKIEELSSSSPLNIINITFEPPDPTIHITPSDSQATITLCLKTDPAQTKTVFVNKTGLIAIKKP